MAFFICLFSVFYFSIVKTDEKNRVEEFKTKALQVSMFTPPALPEIFSCIKTEESSKKEILPKYRSLYAKNSDMTGFIKIPKTPLECPVMHTPKAPEFYLRRFFDKSDNQYGTPFVDGRCTVNPPSDNIIVHGHNMRDSEMFGTLPLYINKEYFLKHPVINFDTIYEMGEYKIVSAFLSQYDSEDKSPHLYYNVIDFDSPEAYDAFSENISKLSLYDTGEKINMGDKFLTLITCNYHVNNGRMTVIAKKMT
ncbi:MAG: class B sortase [Oscillospiraceae bacterium]